MSGGTAHFLVFPRSGWGHLRPTLHVALNLLLIEPTSYATFLADRRSVVRARQEISAHPKLFAAVKSRFTVLPLIEAGSSEDAVADEKASDQECEANFDRCLRETMRGTGDSGFGKAPSVIIMDSFRAGPFISRIRKIGLECGLPAGQPKCLVLSPSMNSPLLSLLDDVLEVEDAEKRFHGDDKALEKTIYELRDPERIRTPCDLPPMKQFEFTPQAGYWWGWEERKISPIVRNVLLASFQGDGYIKVGTPELEPESTKRLPELMKMPLYAVGYPASESGGTEEIPPVVNDSRFPTDDGRVKRFLDDCLKKHGERSVAYISFGTALFPRKAENIDYLVESLLSASPPVPFVFAVAAAAIDLSEATVKRVEDSGMGILCSWVPQRMTLSHPATSFFVTHCGCGSLYEGIMAGLPLVTVPQCADQPMGAAIMTQRGVGIQLYQFSTGIDGFTLANGVKIVGGEKAIRQEMDETLKKLRGPEGEEMRRKMADLRALVSNSWEKGQAREAMIAVGKLIMQR